MLIAQDRWPGPALPGRWRGEAAVGASALVHAVVVATLLLRPGRALPPTPPPIEIEMVQQEASVRGAPSEPAAAPALPQAAPAAATSPEAPPLPTASQAPARSRAASPAASAATKARRAAPEVNLGNGANDFDPLTVTGDNVVPPQPDARYRNLPPRYPAAAARSGAQGTVQIMARIAPNGEAVGFGIVSSSGNADLDAEALRAVRLWHFRPAFSGKFAVPYDYVVNIRFAL